jgi:PDZ domain-containing protein
VNTADEILPPPLEPLWSHADGSVVVAPRVTPHRRWRRVLGIIALTVSFTVSIAGAVASQVSVPWVAIEPGSATAAEDRVEVEGAQTFTPDGDILFLTVRVNRLSLLEIVTKSRDRSIDLVSERDYFGTSTPQQSRQEARDLMVRAKSNAELVALTLLGYDAFDNSGVRVQSLEPGSAADGRLRALQVITAVDGRATPTPQDLVGYLGTLTPGTTVTLAVENADGSEKQTVSVPLGARPDGRSGGFLGISTSQRVSEATDLPLTIDIDSGNVGGNSAGLAFTLAIVDELTEGSLTGNNRVAVTGTIELDGTVGEVGGVPQKAVAARRAGATVFLVPRSLEAQALENAGDMKVIPVSNLDEALAALASIGGNVEALSR